MDIFIFWAVIAIFVVLSGAALYRACRHQVKEVHYQHQKRDPDHAR